ncbi:MAG: hypothetical protein GEU98_12725 [Pseudonocardiaceae bacterium]|nr:hypothetical protein [Pseudonocardiaceae bacterium]
MHTELISNSAPAAIRDCLGPLMRRFSHTDQADRVLPSEAHGDLHIITGFGPTNAPTAGTLSVMLGIIELQRRLQTEMTVIISELGAWNSRNVPWQQLEAVRDQMSAFLRRIGLDESRCTLRSHLDFGNLARAGKIARFLTRQDFLDNSESLLELYDSHGLLSSEIGITVDSLYTVADVLGPAETGTKNILMVSGLEEAYFTELARLVLDRQQAADELSLGWEATIGALYFRVLEGLGGYPKMSKSIPASSIHLGMTADALAEQVLSDDPASQRPLLSAIELASGWDETGLEMARSAYHDRGSEPKRWHKVKQSYLDDFVMFAEQWDHSAP